MRLSRLAWILCGIAVICFGCLTLAHEAKQSRISPPPIAVADHFGGPFELTNQDSQKVTEKSWPGKYLLFYFGFTHCPDICPTGLNKIAEALRLLKPDQASRIQPLFITVDPERDTPAELKTYVSLFYPGLVGLTGTPDQINQIKKGFKVYAEKQGAGPDYMVNHSSFTYLLDSQGRLLGLYPHDMNAETLAQSLNTALASKDN